MRNVCIVLRNTRDTVENVNFSSIIDTFLSGGYFFREVILLDYEEVNSFHKEIGRFLEEADFLCIVAEKILCDALIKNIGNTFALSYAGHCFSGCKPVFCLLPAGDEGAEAVSMEMIPLLNDKTQRSFARMVLRMVGAPGETVQRAIDRAHALSGEQLIYHFTDRYDDQKLEMIYDSLTPKMLADQVLRIVLEELKDYVYTMDDTSLEKRIFEGLTLRKLKLSVAESFTGGGVSARLTKVPGISSVYFEGLNTYNEESKMKRLGVKEFTLSRYGAVSAQTAYEMAEGLLTSSACDVCIATTGLAGPSSDTRKNPVGLCYIAAGINGEIYVNEYHLKGDRNRITQTAINHALFSIYKLIQ